MTENPSKQVARLLDYLMTTFLFNHTQGLVWMPVKLVTNQQTKKLRIQSQESNCDSSGWSESLIRMQKPFYETSMVEKKGIFAEQSKISTIFKMSHHDQIKDVIGL